MRVFSILVDALPDNCYECWYRGYVEGDRKDIHFCEGTPIDNNIIDDPYKGRMSWCPLAILTIVRNQDGVLYIDEKL